MKTLCFIIPYFGKLPCYFNLFLKSCSFNPDYNWIIFTDDQTNFVYPENVKRISMTFDNFKEIVNKKFGMDVNLKRPYKLCDLKPMYGYLFEEYITEYAYWGHCDTDIILGNLKSFLPISFLMKYDKLFCLGHMTIYKNTPTNNRLFMSKYKGEYLYKKILLSEYNNWFDEEWKDDNNINQIFLSLGKRVYQNDLSLNINNLYNKFYRIVYTGFQKGSDVHGYTTIFLPNSLCIWNKGQILWYTNVRKKINIQFFPYIHLQGRKMKGAEKVQDIDIFKIIPDSFEPMESGIESITEQNYNKIKKMRSCYHRLHIHKKNIMCKINSLFSKIQTYHD